MRLRLKSILAAVWTAVRRLRHLRHDDLVDVVVIAGMTVLLGLIGAALVIVLAAGTGVLP